MDMSAMRSSQAEVEEQMTDVVDKQLKGVIMVVKQQAHEEFNSKLQVNRQGIRVAR
jgi:hypothetical protein